MILTGSVRFFGLGKLNSKPPFGACESGPSLSEVALDETLDSVRLLGSSSRRRVLDCGLLGAGKTENSPRLGLLSGATLVEVSSESLSSLLP